ALYPVIPAKAGIPHRKRALRAPLQKYPLKEGAGRPALQCARSALYLRWIPAPVQARGKLCAGMARYEFSHRSEFP
ncbi:MAG: hypothetical protein OXU54_07750, partial [Gammaproteobacteria bacterium]|nr:hypothetical protein [Gammaproteobacteria bacterium]